MIHRKFAKLSARNLWRRVFLRDIEFSDSYDKINAAYLRKDPWGLNNSHADAHRFLETNGIIRTNFGQVRSMLEIGCGEGLHSLLLGHLCESLHGIDVSGRAIERAKSRYPDGNFSKGDIFSVHGSFDLAVACEVLYYVKDIPAALDRMCEISAASLVTYYQKYDDMLASHLSKMPNIQRYTIRHGAKQWTAAWWRNGPN